MSDFTPIETQEDLDKIITARLARQKESIEAKYPDYDKIKNRLADLEAENGTLKKTTEKYKTDSAQHEKTVAELNEKISGYEKANMRTQIALKSGLPLDLADRLVGDDEAGMQADAQRLADLIGNQQPVPPLKGLESSSASDEDSAYQSLIEE